MIADQLFVGLKVRSNREFSGVPKGTIGIVLDWEGKKGGEKHSRDHLSVEVEWQNLPTANGQKRIKPLVDWFAEDELQFLDALPEKDPEQEYEDEENKAIAESQARDEAEQKAREEEEAEHSHDGDMPPEAMG
jgi:hypothetical protein